MKATEIKNYQNLTAKDIVSYMKNNNISTITSGSSFTMTDLTSKRDGELDKLINMLKSNSDRLRIENQFEIVMKEQNQLSLTIGANRVFVNSRYGK